MYEEASQECQIQHMESFATLLSSIEINGFIEGQEYIAAWTCGDGACALHAIFGVPISNCLEAGNVRERLLANMEADLLPLVASLPASLQHALEEMLEAVWAEVKAAAEKNKRHDVLDTEETILWNATPMDIQRDLLEFVEVQRLEAQQDSRLMEQIMKFA